MENQHNLIVKYLELIQEQENIINELSKSNKTLLDKNNELKQQKYIYRNSAKEWKEKYESLKQDIVSNVKSNLTVSQAIEIYRQNQGC